MIKVLGPAEAIAMRLDMQGGMAATQGKGATTSQHGDILQQAENSIVPDGTGCGLPQSSFKGRWVAAAGAGVHTHGQCQPRMARVQHVGSMGVSCHSGTQGVGMALRTGLSSNATALGLGWGQCLRHMAWDAARWWRVCVCVWGGVFLCTTLICLRQQVAAESIARLGLGRIGNAL